MAACMVRGMVGCKNTCQGTHHRGSAHLGTVHHRHGLRRARHLGVRDLQSMGSGAA